MSATDATPDGTRRARIAVLGEFSAGKSTFINLVTGGKTLRTQVTATQMPAVWMTYGTGSPIRVDLDGTESPVDPGDPSSISVADTAYIKVFMQTPVLELCDLIDTPGNSDPNIAPVAWERIADIADVAVWCSPATQAWRQSEAAAWSEMPQSLRDNSVLLLTRSDKLTSQADREKVLRRVRGEAGDLFSAVHMGSLLNFYTIQHALRDVLELCRSIDETRTPDAIETAHILREMFTAAEPSPPPRTQEDLADEAFALAETESAASLLPDEEETEAGAATALWMRLTDELPPDDPDALDRAFDRFLTQLDREIRALREIANIGKVG